eukprot:1064394-Amphidinium_carterae.2
MKGVIREPAGGFHGTIHPDQRPCPSSALQCGLELCKGDAGAVLRPASAGVERRLPAKSCRWLGQEVAGSPGAKLGDTAPASDLWTQVATWGYLAVSLVRGKLARRFAYWPHQLGQNEEVVRPLQVLPQWMLRCAQQVAIGRYARTSNGLSFRPAERLWRAFGKQRLRSRAQGSLCGLKSCVAWGGTLVAKSMNARSIVRSKRTNTLFNLHDRVDVKGGLLVAFEPSLRAGAASRDLCT